MQDEVSKGMVLGEKEEEASGVDPAGLSGLTVLELSSSSTLLFVFLLHFVPL